jgi:DNA-directed RNA polymerase subunit RPC12/RpoP
MPIPENDMHSSYHRFSTPTRALRGAALLWLFAVALGLTACKKDVAVDASDSDSNGYVCAKCGVKLYTARSNFIGPRCPKCNEDALMDVVGYRCAKDGQVVIQPRQGGRSGAPVCEKCQASLVNSMFLPREKDLKAWGAAFVLCANDPVGVVGGVKHFRTAFSLDVDVVTGPATDNCVGTRRESPVRVGSSTTVTPTTCVIL